MSPFEVDEELSWLVPAIWPVLARSARVVDQLRREGVGGTNRRDDIWQMALRRPEPLGDQPDAKGDFKESTRERQQERDVDPEDLGDRTT